MPKRSKSRPTVWRHHSLAAGPRREAGFTVLEVIVSMAVLAVIIVPLTTSFVQSLRQTSEVADRLAHSNDAQRISAAWTKDVQSLEKVGVKVNGACAGLRTGSSGTDLVTFQWDQSSVAAGSGQPTLVPKTATWAVTGAGDDMVLTRRYCENDSPVREEFLANHFGVTGKAVRATVFGPAGSGATQFCETDSCTIVVSGAFDHRLEVARRVPGGTPDSPTPPPPTITGVTARSTYLSVAWTPPSLPAGVSPIIGYHVEAWTSPTGGVAGSTDINASSNAADITGLENGTDYWVVAFSKNLVGQGEPSAAFGPVRPAPTVPTIPLSVTVVPGTLASPLSTTVSWLSPIEDGSSAIDLYEVQGTRSDGQAVSAVQVSGGTLTTSVTGLSADWSYTFRVRAHNGVGWGPLSDPGTGSTRPPKPTAVTASASAARGFVTFTTSGNGAVSLAATGAVRISANCVTASAACTNQTYVLNHPTPTAPNGTFGPLDTGTSPGAVALVNGQQYRFAVELKNVAGDWSPVSDPSPAVTPLDKPVPPTNVVSIASTSATHNLRFTMVAGLESGGSPISSYVVAEVGGQGRTLTVPAASSGPTVADWTGSASGQSWTMFNDFQDYVFTVKACNDQGCGGASAQLTAAPGVVPVATLTVARGGSPRQVSASVSAVPSTATSSTTWQFSCPGAANGSAFGLTPAAVLTNVNVGVQTCSGVGTNTVKVVSNGVAGTLPLTGTASMATVDVYGPPGTPTAPTVSIPSTGVVNSVTLTATNLPASGGTDGSIEWQATCGSQSSTWGASPRTVTGLAQGTTVTCTLAVRSVTSGYVATSPAVSKKLQRTIPILVSAIGSKTIPVQESGSNDFNAGRFHALVILRADPGLSVTGMKSSLTAAPSGSFSTSNYLLWKSQANGNDVDYYLWVTITPPNGNWPSIPGGGPRAAARTAGLHFELTGGDTVTNAAVAYWVVAEWGGSGTAQDYPAVFATGASTYGSTVAAGGTFTAAFSCDDNDTNFLSSDDECDFGKIRIRNMATDATVQISNNVDANDGTSRSYNFTVPAGTPSGRWVIEGEFCNENGSCPASPPSGYDGSDHQLLGYFTIP